MSRGGRRKKSPGGFRRTFLLLLVGAFAGAGFVVWMSRSGGRFPGREAPPVALRTPGATVSSPPATPAATRTPRPPAAPVPADFESAGRAAEPRLVVVLDDLGFKEDALARLASRAEPLTLAVIPSAPHAREAAALAAQKRWDLLVHFPMASDAERTEAGTIGSADDDATIAARVAAALDRFPGAIGLNNHQGSRATRDPRVMRAVLGVLKTRGLLFLDSRTTAATVGEAEAKRLGLVVFSRDVFLDDATAEAEEAAEGGGTDEALAKAWKRSLDLSKKRGRAIVIGHPHAETLGFLERELPRAAAAGVRLAKLSELVD